MAQQNFSNRSCLRKFLGLSEDQQVLEWLHDLFAFTDSDSVQRELLKYNQQILLHFSETVSGSSQFPYSRQILWKSDDFEVMLARWNKQMSCSPHNHGFSRGFVWFVEGDFEESGYVFQQGNLVPQGKTTWMAGDVSHVRTDDIHSCRPQNGGVTLHFYSPPIHQMKVYSHEQKTTYTVSDTCGAWAPVDPSDLIAAVPWGQTP